MCDMSRMMEQAQKRDSLWHLAPIASFISTRSFDTCLSIRAPVLG